MEDNSRVEGSSQLLVMNRHRESAHIVKQWKRQPGWNLVCVASIRHTSRCRGESQPGPGAVLIT